MNAHCTPNQDRKPKNLEQSESVTISKSRPKCQTPRPSRALNVHDFINLVLGIFLRNVKFLGPCY